MKYIILTLFLFLDFAVADYIWPTDASNTLTGTFCEERPFRYHAGIDIRTYGKKAKIFAIESGYIERIRTGSKGYGKVIYLRLKDGNIAVYAHLDRFDGDLDRVARRIQERSKSYTIDYSFKKNEFPVKKGQIIGYTGDTGALSGPHLHFEIRSPDNKPLNPAQYGIRANDRTAPVPIDIVIKPAGSRTTIDGYNDRSRYYIEKINGQYIVRDTISVVGDFNISINTKDYIDGSPFSFGVYDILMKIDDQEVYRITYDMLHYEEQKDIYKERDYELNEEYGGNYYRLNPKGYESNFIKLRPKRDVFRFNDQNYHDVTITVTDHEGNASDVSFVIFNKYIQSKEPAVIQDGGRTYVRFQDDNTVPTFFSSSPYINDKFFLLESTHIGGGTYEINFNFQSPYTSLHIESRTTEGVRLRNYFYNLDASSPYPEGDFSIIHNEYGIVIKFIEQSFTGLDAYLSLKDSGRYNKINLFRKEKNVLQTTILDPTRYLNIEEIQIHYDNNPEIVLRKKIHSKMISTDEAFSLPYNIGSVVVRGDRNTFDDRTMIWIDVPDRLDEKVKRTIEYGPISLMPNLKPFNSDMSIDFKTNGEKNIGIFSFNGKKGSWEYIESTSTKRKNIISCDVRSGGAYSVIRDLNKPIIKNMIPGNGGMYRSEDINELSFNIVDEFPGIDGENDISLTLNDKPLIFEYNSYQKKVSYTLDSPLQPGLHTIKINASDYLGNRVKKNIRFSVE